MSVGTGQGSTILIKAQSASGEDEVEEIEIDATTTGLLEHFSTVGVSTDGIIDGSEIVDVQGMFYEANQGENNGNTYILNQETGEIQLFELNNQNTTTIDGEEIEVVTVDADRLFNNAGGVSSNDLDQFSSSSSYRTPDTYEIITNNTMTASTSRSHVTQVVPAVTHISRMKNGPALLRNSRRIATAVDHVTDEGNRNCAGSSVNIISSSLRNRASKSTGINNGSNRKSRITPSSSKVREKSQQELLQRSLTYATIVGPDGNCVQQVLMLNQSAIDEVGHVGDPLHSVKIQQPNDTAAQNSVPGNTNYSVKTEQAHKQPTYFIYQDADGDQVAEIIEESDSTDPSFDQSTTNIIYQFENNAVFLNDGDMASAVTLTVPKLSKSTKKRSKKASQRDESNLSKIKKGSTELKCLENGCNAVAYNVSELRKHLTVYHEMTFDMGTILFPCEATFKEWREQYERERMVSFIYRGGTKKIAKDQAVTYMICHRSGHYKPTMEDVSKRKRKMKPQGSCKIGGYCTAGIKLLKNLDTGAIKMDICHTHYGHPLDSEAIPHLRVNPTLRKIILKKFEEGMNFTDVLAYIHHNPDGLEGLRMVDRRAVRNIYDTWKKPVKRSKKSHVKGGSFDFNEAVEMTDVDGSDRICNDDITDGSESCNTDLQNNATDSEVLLDEPCQDNQSDNCETKPAVYQNVDTAIMPEQYRESFSDESTTNESHSVIAENNEPEADVEAEEMIMEEEEAPTLYIEDGVNELDEVDEQLDEDLDPPLLIAIESVKSLKAPSPVSSNKSEKAKTSKNAKNTRKSKSELETKPVIVKSERVNPNMGPKVDATAPDSAAVSYSLRPNRKVEVFNKSKRAIRKAEESELTSDNANRGSEEIGESKISKRKQKMPAASVSKERTRSVSPTPAATDLVQCDSPTFHLLEDEDDFDMMQQIQISSKLEASIDKLHNHGESGPSLLLYKKIGEINTKYGGFCRAFREDDFCLIIQTPVQRQIMQMFPKIIGIEILDGPKPNEHDLKLAFIMVLDDFREAIPVAWMVADTMCSRILNQFFRMLRYHCGELPVQYIMAPKNADVYKTWTTHFSNKPKILQSEFYVKRDLRNLVNRHFPNDCTRSATWDLVEKMICEKSIVNLKGLIRKLNEVVKEYQNGANFLKKMEKDWLSRIGEWSFAYRVGASPNLLFVAEGFTKLKKFVSFKGTKKLNQSVDHILKIGYDKCFLRTKRMFKGDQKFSFMLEQVEKSHNISRDVLSNIIITEYENEHRWKVETEDDMVAEIFHLQSHCDCKIVCKVCKICVHEYMCSCDDFAKQHLMCAHIHKVHCFRNNVIEGSQHIEIESADLQSELITVPDLSKSEVSLCEGTEITILNENQIKDLNLSEVLLQAAGLLRREDGQDMPKIVSITDADTQKVIYDGNGHGPIIFEFEAD